MKKKKTFRLKTFVCPVCEIPFVAFNIRHRVYCSKKCRSKNEWDKVTPEAKARYQRKQLNKRKLAILARGLRYRHATDEQLMQATPYKSGLVG